MFHPAAMTFLSCESHRFIQITTERKGRQDDNTALLSFQGVILGKQAIF